jgi:hypothetical protein
VKWLSTHGCDNSDIYQTDDGKWELVRKVIGFGIERVSIIHDGERVHQLEAVEGLRKAMDWVAAQTKENA